MKLKIKLPLLFCLLVAVLTSLLAVYLRLDAFQTIWGRVTDVRQQVQLRDEQLAGLLGRYPLESPELQAVVRQTAQEQRIAITLYDLDLQRKLLSAGEPPRDGNRLTNWQPVRDPSGLVYMVEVVHLVEAREFRVRLIFTRTLILLVSALAVLALGLALYFHFFITKPIARLNSRLSAVSYTRTLPPLESARRDEIGELYRYVREMEGRLREGRAEQARMIGAIAHDLKTPLTSISGFLELLRTRPGISEERKQEYLELIRIKSDHITELVRQFSGFSKNEMELEEARLEPVALAPLMASLAMEYEAELAGFEHRLMWEGHFYNGERVLASEAMLRRVFANLIGNAVRYGDRESLTVRMKGRREGHSAILTVEDDGIGVPEQLLGRLFERFYTVDEARRSERGGTGLGLAACRSVVERHGGRIFAYRSELGGLGIRLELPLADG
jgi:signal transduction histidine kinase